jgi:hypothetical protein
MLSCDCGNTSGCAAKTLAISPACMISGIASLFIASSLGIEVARMSSVYFLRSPLTSGISIWKQRNTT